MAKASRSPLCARSRICNFSPITDFLYYTHGKGKKFGTKYETCEVQRPWRYAHNLQDFTSKIFDRCLTVPPSQTKLFLCLACCTLLHNRESITIFQWRI